MRIRLTESELISLIRQTIKEQGQIGDGRTKFENCRGIKAGSWRDRKAGSSNKPAVGWSNKAQKRLEREIRGEDKAELKTFNKANGLNLDMEYYTILKDEALKIKNYNETNRYNILFDESGKPFTKNMTQSKANDISTLFIGGSVWYFYWRDIFGAKTPSIMDLYKYIEGIGGKSKYMELVNSNYNIEEYGKRYDDSVELAENELQRKFPFEKPSGKTPFYFMWYEGQIPKFRYFNTYEEFNLSIQIVQQEGNKTSSGPDTNGANTAGSASFSTKPSKGTAIQQLLK
jgi:hypothetical protein